MANATENPNEDNSNLAQRESRLSPLSFSPPSTSYFSQSEEPPFRHPPCEQPAEPKSRCCKAMKQQAGMDVPLLPFKYWFEFRSFGP